MKNKKCFAGTFKIPVFYRGALVCVGGFGQPQCKHLRKCIEQYSGEVPDKIVNETLKLVKDFPKIAVVSGNKKQFDDFVKQNKDQAVLYYYVDSMEKLRGCNFDGYLTTGTYEELKDIVDIIYHLRINIKRNEKL